MTLKLLSSVLVLLTISHINCGPVHYSSLSSNKPTTINYSINTRKSVHVVSDKFLSFTIDPESLLRSADCEISKATINMIKGLAPAYIRVGGTDSNKYVFQPSLDSVLPEKVSVDYKRSASSKNYTITGLQWMWLNDFVKEAGLDMIVSLNGGANNGGGHGLSDLSNALTLISFSDKFDYNLGWELGYELQNIANDRGKEMGRDVVRLRKMLEAFPKYHNSLILGPDMVGFYNKEDATFIKNYLAEAGNSLNIFTWHPNLTNLKEDEDPVSRLQTTLTNLDNYIWIKDGLFKSVSRGIVPKKPIWIGESEKKPQRGDFKDVMLWAKKLGAAAKLGISVYMRKPYHLSLFEPTPEYWFALLHKTLIGKIVLDIRNSVGINNYNNGSSSGKLQMFSHCTKISEKLENQGIINGSLKYVKGAVTVFGVNMAYEKRRVFFKIGLKSDENQPIHQYILTDVFDENTGSSKVVLLNGQLLTLSKDEELPMLSPRIKISNGFVSVPSRSIFFLVFPEAKCKACNEDSNDTPKWKKNNHYNSAVEEDESEEDEESEQELRLNNNNNSIQEAIEENIGNYVTFPKRNKLAVSAESKNEPVVKYVTFNEDSWLSEFPEKLHPSSSSTDTEKDDDEVTNEDEEEEEEETEDDEGKTIDQRRTESMTEPTSSSAGSRHGKYKIFAQALLGKRNNNNNSSSSSRRDPIVDEISSYFEEEAKLNKKSSPSSRYKRLTTDDKNDFYYDEEEIEDLLMEPVIADRLYGPLCRERYYYPKSIDEDVNDDLVVQLVPYGRSEDDVSAEEPLPILSTTNQIIRMNTKPPFETEQVNQEEITGEDIVSSIQQRSDDERKDEELASPQAELLSSDSVQQLGTIDSNRSHSEVVGEAITDTVVEPEKTVINDMTENEIDDFRRKRESQDMSSDSGVDSVTELLPPLQLTNGGQLSSELNEDELFALEESTNVNGLKQSNELIDDTTTESDSSSLSDEILTTKEQANYEQNTTITTNGDLLQTDRRPVGIQRMTENNNNNNNNSNNDNNLSLLPANDKDVELENSQRGSRDTMERFVTKKQDHDDDDDDKEDGLIVSPFGKNAKKIKKLAKNKLMRSANVLTQSPLSGDTGTKYESKALYDEPVTVAVHLPPMLEDILRIKEEQQKNVAKAATAEHDDAAAGAEENSKDNNKKHGKLDKSTIDKLLKEAEEKRQIRINEAQNRRKNRLASIRKQLDEVMRQPQITRKRRSTTEYASNNNAAETISSSIGDDILERKKIKSKRRPAAASSPTTSKNDHHRIVVRRSPPIDDQKPDLRALIDRILDMHEDNMKHLHNHLESRAAEIRKNVVHHLKTEPKNKRETNEDFVGVFLTDDIRSHHHYQRQEQNGDSSKSRLKNDEERRKRSLLTNEIEDDEEIIKSNNKLLKDVSKALLSEKGFPAPLELLNGNSILPDDDTIDQIDRILTSAIDKSSSSSSSNVIGDMLKGNFNRQPIDKILSNTSPAIIGTILGGNGKLARDLSSTTTTIGNDIVLPPSLRIIKDSIKHSPSRMIKNIKLLTGLVNDIKQLDPRMATGNDEKSNDIWKAISASIKTIPQRIMTSSRQNEKKNEDTVVKSIINGETVENEEKLIAPLLHQLVEIVTELITTTNTVTETRKETNDNIDIAKIDNNTNSINNNNNQLAVEQQSKNLPTAISDDNRMTKFYNGRRSSLLEDMADEINQISKKQNIVVTTTAEKPPENIEGHTDPYDNQRIINNKSLLNYFGNLPETDDLWKNTLEKMGEIMSQLKYCTLWS